MPFFLEHDVREIFMPMLRTLSQCLSNRSPIQCDDLLLSRLSDNTYVTRAGSAFVHTTSLKRGDIVQRRFPIKSVVIIVHWSRIHALTSRIVAPYGTLRLVAILSCT